jgi:hypothetical protein
MKIEKWAVCRKDGSLYCYSQSKKVAEGVAENHNCIAVLLTGEMPEPKKKAKLAPALCRSPFRSFWLSDDLYENEQEAKNGCPDFFSWPAPVPDEGGFIEVEVES